MSVKNNVFIVGDSISIQYGHYLKRMLGDGVLYARKEGTDEALKNLDIPRGANGGDSSMVLKYLTAKVKEPGFNPDVLLLNCGLHDIKTLPETGERQVGIDRYDKNLGEIIELLNANDIPCVWIRTTPVDDDTHNSKDPGFHRFNQDVVRYNNVADKLFKSNNTPVIDLYNFTLNLKDQDIYCDHVHFNEKTRELQAAYIAGFVADFLR